MTRGTGAVQWVGVLLIVTSVTLWAADVPGASFAVGQKVEVREGDVWSTASIVKQEGRRFQVHYENSPATSDEWVSVDRMRLPGTAGAAQKPAGAVPGPAGAPPGAAGAPPVPAKPIPQYANGEKVEFKSGPFWHKTAILNKRGSWYLVQENPRGDREWVEYWRIRKPGSKEDTIGNADSWGKVKNAEGPPREDAGDPPAPGESTRDLLKRAATAALEKQNPALPAVRTALHVVAVDPAANAPILPDADVVARPFSNKPIVLSGAAGTFGERVNDLFFSTGATGIAVTTYLANDQIRLDRVDLVGGRTLNTLQMPAGRTCAALSADGKLLLTLNKPEGLTPPDRADVWNIEGPAPKLVFGFRPFGPSGKDQPGIDWARFVGNDKLLTLSTKGELVVWDFKASAIWSVGTEQFRRSVTLSANGKYVAFFVGQTIAILDSQTGKTLKVLHDLPKDRRGGAISFKPDGTQLAVVAQDMLFIYDLQSGALKHELYPPVPSPAGQQVDHAVSFLSEGYMLTHGDWVKGDQNLVGLEQRMIVWQLVPEKFHKAQHGGAFAGKFWYTFPPASNVSKPVLMNFTVPYKEMLAALGKLNLSAEMAVRPGMSVTLALTLPTPASWRSAHSPLPTPSAA